MVVMKEDMDTRFSLCMLSNGWDLGYKGLLDEANENILCMEIFGTQGGNTLRESQLCFSHEMPVQILLGGHSTLSLQGGLSRNRDEEKKRKGHVYMQLEL
ncbi:hypothetical protein Tco_0196870 [Tanacetum coccineum]